MENLARYIIRSSFSQERMRYLADERSVIYAAKDGNERKIFDVEEWLAAMCSQSQTGKQTEWIKIWRSRFSKDIFLDKQMRNNSFYFTK